MSAFNILFFISYVITMSVILTNHCLVMFKRKDPPCAIWEGGVRNKFSDK